MSMRTFNSIMTFIGGSVRRLAVFSAVVFFFAGQYLGYWEMPSLVNVNVQAPPAVSEKIAEIAAAIPVPAVQGQTDLWIETREYSAAENEARHFKKHGDEFPFSTAQEYTAVAQSFVSKPPKGTLSVVQKDNDRVFYNPELNFFAVTNKKGQLRTFYRLDPEIHGHDSNMEYFRKQEGR